METILELIEAYNRLLVTDPLSAADKLDQVANVLRLYAANLRQSASQGGGRAPTSPGGLGDSCRLRVAGPDGSIKQEVSA